MLLARSMNTRRNGELAHEIGEFRTLAARRSLAHDHRPGAVLRLLRARTGQAVLPERGDRVTTLRLAR